MRFYNETSINYYEPISNFQFVDQKSKAIPEDIYDYIFSFPHAVPELASFFIHPINTSSIIIYWNVLPNRIIESYTVIYTRLCDNEKKTITIEHGTSNSIAIYNLYPGLQYSISIIPVNILGEGMEMTDTVTLNDSSTFVTI